MKKKLIKKVLYEHIKDCDDDFIPEDYRKKVGNAKVVRMQYDNFIMYYPINANTAKDKTQGELFKLVEGSFIKQYKEAIKRKMEENEDGI